MGICGVDCEICDFKMSCNGCSMCEASICSKACGYCEALCPNRYNNSINSIRLLNAIGVDLSLKSNLKINVPQFIPGISDKLNIDIDMPLIAFDGNSLLSSNGRNISKRFLEKGLNGALGLDSSTKSLVHFYIRDRKLNGFWWNRNDIYDKLVKLNLYAITSLNFSVYEDTPRMDHIYNINRNIIVFNEMIDHGLPAILDIPYYSISDLKNWCDKINKYRIKSIAFSFQVVDVRLKASNDWKNYLGGFRYLCENTDPEVNIIIKGVSSYHRFEYIRAAAAGHKLSIISESPYIQSRRGILSETGRKCDKLKCDELLEMNLKYYKRLYC